MVEGEAVGVPLGDGVFVPFGGGGSENARSRSRSGWADAVVGVAGVITWVGVMFEGGEVRTAISRSRSNEFAAMTSMTKVSLTESKVHGGRAMKLPLSSGGVGRVVLRMRPKLWLRFSASGLGGDVNTAEAGFSVSSTDDRSLLRDRSRFESVRRRDCIVIQKAQKHKRRPDR